MNFSRSRGPSLTVGPAALIGLLILTVGCAPRPQDCSQADTVCIGLVTDFGAVTDGLSREAWLALEDALAAGMVDRADFIETMDTRDRLPNISEFAENGYDIIVTVGAGSSDGALQAAERFPALRFISIQPTLADEKIPDNFTALLFHDERAGFLAGALAGMTTRTGRVAAVCEAAYIDSVRRNCDGFRLGALYTRPNAAVEVLHRVGSTELLFRDTAWGTSTAIATLDRGSDVLYAVGEGTAEAALEAAARRGALVIGAQTDQYPVRTEIQDQIVSSAVLEVRAGLLAIIQDMAEGQGLQGIYWGEVALAPLRNFEARLDPRRLEDLQRIQTDLNSGVIQLEGP